MKHELSNEKNVQNKHNSRIFYSETKSMLNKIPTQKPKLPINFFKKQVQEQAQCISYSRDHLSSGHYSSSDFLQNSQENSLDISELQIAVITQVAENLWMNFCACGKDSPMLRHLQNCLRKQYGEELVFKYNKNAREVLIMLKINDRFLNLKRKTQLSLLDRARQISQEMVSSYVQTEIETY